MSLAGYVALRAWTGPRMARRCWASSAALVSSTATTLVYARHSKLNDGMLRLSAVVILIASQVVLIRLVVVSGIVSPRNPQATRPGDGAGTVVRPGRYLCSTGNR